MVTAWLTAQNDETTPEFVHRLLDGEGVKGVGGFSLLCGKLRRQKEDRSDELEPLAIISNRAGSPDDVPWIADKRGEVYGLSNTCYNDPAIWPKVEKGKELLQKVVREASTAGLSEEELVDDLFSVLDTDTLPKQEGQDFEAYIYQLRKSIFIPPIGQAVPLQHLPQADEIAAAKPIQNGSTVPTADVKLKVEERPDAAAMTGIYGTQRQTIILVDWEGHVTFRERSLWDEEGNGIERGKADVKFDFQIEGWKGESKGNEAHPLSVL